MTFAVGMCVVLAVLLSGTFSLLKDTVDGNIQFDRQRNVLIATGPIPLADSRISILR